VYELDDIDFSILRRLAGDARLSHVGLSELVGLSPTACAKRIRVLEELGVIQGYRVGFDLSKLGYPLIVMVRISLQTQSQSALVEFETGIKKCRSVLSCFLMSGEDDYLVEVAARDIADYESIHHNELSRLPHVARIQSSFAMRSVIRREISDAMLGSHGRGKAVRRK